MIDASWDDDLVSGVDLTVPELEISEEEEESEPEVDGFGDRVTAIPSMPPEMMARELMAQVPESAPPRHITPVTPRGMKAVRAPSLELPFTSPSSPSPEYDENDPATEPRRVPSEDDLDLSLGPPLELELATDDGATAAPVKETERAAAAAAPVAASDPATEMKDRYAMGDFSGALIVAESLLEANPDDDQANRYAESCRDVLIQMYSARLGPSDQLVVVAVPPDQIRWLSLDHRAGFLLSMIDGSCSIDELLDVSGMARLEAMRILFMLFEQQVIRLEPSG